MPSPSEPVRRLRPATRSTPPARLKPGLDRAMRILDGALPQPRSSRLDHFPRRTRAPTDLEGDHLDRLPAAESTRRPAPGAGSARRVPAADQRPPTAHAETDEEARDQPSAKCEDERRYARGSPRRRLPDTPRPRSERSPISARHRPGSSGTRGPSPSARQTRWRAAAARYCPSESSANPNMAATKLVTIASAWISRHTDQRMELSARNDIDARAWRHHDRGRRHPRPEDQPDLEQPLDRIVQPRPSRRVPPAPGSAAPRAASIHGTAVSTSTILNAAE